MKRSANQRLDDQRGQQLLERLDQALFWPLPKIALKRATADDESERHALVLRDEIVAGVFRVYRHEGIMTARTVGELLGEFSNSKAILEAGWVLD